jgi:glucokinase
VRRRHGNRFALVADLGGTKIAVARVTPSGEITHRSQIFTPAAGGKDVVDAIGQLLSQLPREGACAAGVAVPGLARPDGSVWAPNLRGWTRMPLARMLRKRLGLPVLLESDRNACVLGEAWQGRAQNCSDAAFVAVGTGIGAGIISGGRLLRGSAELAGCLGWLPVREKFLAAYKTIGCLEYYVAGPGIARSGHRAFGATVAPEHIVALARSGDARARRILADAGDALGVSFAAVVDILNPQIIVVGGGMAAAGDLLLAPARRALRQWAQPLAGRQVRVVRSGLGSRAPLLGLAKICFERFPQ